MGNTNESGHGDNSFFPGCAAGANTGLGGKYEDEQPIPMNDLDALGLNLVDEFMDDDNYDDEDEEVTFSPLNAVMSLLTISNDAVEKCRSDDLNDRHGAISRTPSISIATERNKKSVKSYVTLSLEPPEFVLAPDSCQSRPENLFNDKNLKVGTAKPILTEEEVEDLRLHLPSSDRFAGCWCLRYSPEEHGVSLGTLYRQLENIEAAIVVVIETTNGEVFGGYSNVPFSPKVRYYGNHSCFVFNRNSTKKRAPDEPRKALDAKHAQNAGHAPDYSLNVHPWAVKDNFFVFSDLEGFGMGGGTDEADGFAWWIQSEFLRGETRHSSTFDNPPFVDKPDFVIKHLQIWSLEHECRDLTVKSEGTSNKEEFKVPFSDHSRNKPSLDMEEDFLSVNHISDGAPSNGIHKPHPSPRLFKDGRISMKMLSEPGGRGAGSSADPEEKIHKSSSKKNNQTKKHSAASKKDDDEREDISTESDDNDDDEIPFEGLGSVSLQADTISSVGSPRVPDEEIQHYGDTRFKCIIELKRERRRSDEEKESPRGATDESKRPTLGEDVDAIEYGRSNSYPGEDEEPRGMSKVASKRKSFDRGERGG